MNTRARGFTIAELITVVAIIGVLASVAMPIVTFGIRRQKEIELRERLRKITNAIDMYHELRNAQGPAAIKKPPDFGQRDWPKKLEELTKPIELIVVVTIIGILAGVAISNVRYAQQKARDAALRHDLFEMRKAIDDYYADKQKYPESLHALETDRYLRKIPKDPITGRQDWE